MFLLLTFFIHTYIKENEVYDFLFDNNNQNNKHDNNNKPDKEKKLPFKYESLCEHKNFKEWALSWWNQSVRVYDDNMPIFHSYIYLLFVHYALLL